MGTQKKQTQEKVFAALNDATEVVTYFGANNDGRAFQDDVILGILEELRQAKYILQEVFGTPNEINEK